MAQFHWDPDRYLDLMHQEVPDYERLQAELVAASRGVAARAILELGTGTGETARRVLAAHPEARLVGIDSSRPMLDRARRTLEPARVRLERRRLEAPLPDGPFDLVVSALAIHHLQGPGKRDLFVRTAVVVRPGGRFVIADGVDPERPEDAITPIDPDYDHPSTVAEQLEWLADAGFTPSVAWRRRDLAVLVGDLPAG